MDLHYQTTLTITAMTTMATIATSTPTKNNNNNGGNNDNNINNNSKSSNSNNFCPFKSCYFVFRRSGSRPWLRGPVRETGGTAAGGVEEGEPNCSIFSDQNFIVGQIQLFFFTNTWLVKPVLP